jgi:hypothetical protein
MNCRTLTRFLSCALALATVAPARAEFTPIAGFGRQVFPSYIIATASIEHTPDGTPSTQLGDPRGQFGVEIVAPADNAPIRVEVQCGDYLDKSVFSGVLPKAGVAYRVCPVVKYNYSTLARCTQSTPATATYRVRLSEGPEQEQAVTCILRTINDCPFALTQDDGVLDVSYTFAAYVNEQHPFVDKLLREALDIGIVTAFDGYQSGPENTMLQAYALWDLLVARNIQYSSITASAVHSELVGSQHVRMIEQSINNSQANCVDGSVLWASLLQRIGIDSYLVVEAEHCYAGFYLDAEHTAGFAVETTLVGSEMDLEDVEVPEFLDKAIPEEMRDDYSFPSFVVAVSNATGKLAASLEADEAATELAKSADDSGDKPRESSEDQAPPVQVIDIPEARRLGILPIAFQDSEEFVWYDYSLDEEEEDEEYSDEETEEEYEEDEGSDDEESDLSEDESYEEEEEVTDDEDSEVSEDEEEEDEEYTDEEDDEETYEEEE